MINNPSPYQQEIFEAIKAGSQSLGVNAVAGSGKTSTIVHACELIDEGVFVAFNKSIAEELRHRISNQDLEVATIHSMGLKTLKKEMIRQPNNWVFGGKYHQLCKEVMEDANFSIRQYPDMFRTLKRLVNHCQTALVEPAIVDLDVFEAATGCSTDFPMLPELAEKVLQIGIDSFSKTIDFTDMVWLPLVLKLNITQFERVFIDEAQDLSPMLREFSLRLAKEPETDIVFVGDPRQAIYGFAGADTQSFQRIADRLKARQLPLSVCYRCPTSHIELAKQIVPQIEAFEFAKEGEVETLPEHKVLEKAEQLKEVLIICRVTKPIVKLTMEFLKRGIPAKIKGRDIMENLYNYVRMNCNGDDIGTAIEGMQKAYDIAYAKFVEKPYGDEVLQELQDKQEACTILIEKAINETGVNTLAQFEAFLNGLFTDSLTSITLSTIHKAKGLEHENVIFYGTNLVPHKMAKTASQREQEYNLKYIALTRSKKYLGMCDISI